MRTAWIFCIIFFILNHPLDLVESSILDSNELSLYLSEISRERLGVNAMQYHLDKNVKFLKRFVNFEADLNQLSSSLDTKFNSYINAARKLEDAIERNYGDFTKSPTQQECCHSRPRERDERFKAKVDLGDACIQISETAPHRNQREYFHKGLAEVMKENMKNLPSLKWQYVGTEQGITITYPMAAMGTCSDYDNRFRPWYVESATPEPKDVVIVIDKSGSMSHTVSHSRSMSRLDVAKDAANSVLDTLNPSDRVAVVGFNQGTLVAPGDHKKSLCFGNQLALAIPQNKAILKKNVDGFHAAGGTTYASALKVAFSLFKNSADFETNSTKKRSKAILFLTDGEPTDAATKDIFTTIENENKMISNEIVILTYGIGGAAALNEAILSKMAKMTSLNGRVGEYTRVGNIKTLRHDMSSYYNFFSNVEYNHPIISTPYVDAWGLGMVTSICLPLHYTAKFKGVVCVDMTMEDLMEDATYFTDGEGSYTFIIDQEERTMVHPLLPKPYLIEDDPIFVPVHNIERGAEVKSIIASMTSGGNGSKTVTSQQVFPRGAASMEGVYTRTVISKYGWRPIEGTKLSFCMVIPKDDVAYEIVSRGPLDQFYYHRIDMENYKKCKHFDTAAAIKDRSTVFFAAKTFLDPYSFLGNVETYNNIERYVGYMKGNGENPGFKPDIRDTVSVMRHIDDFWRMDEAVLWLYIGTANGIFKMFPGSYLQRSYDPTVRPWYLRAVANKGKMVLSAYEDALGLGYVVTMSYTLHKGQDASGNDGPLFGVMGYDFNFKIFYNKIIERYPKCNDKQYSCFIMDTSGFILLHKDFVECDKSDQQIDGLHITVKEPDIASHLISNGFMKRGACMDFDSIKYYYTWTMDYDRIQNDFVDTMKYSGDPNYELHVLTDTNALVGIKKKPNGAKSSECKCSSATSYNSAKYQCVKLDSSNKFCECPCYSRAQFDYCNNDFPMRSDGYPTCTPDIPPLKITVNIDKETVQSYDACLKINCLDKETRSDCLHSGVCEWNDAEKCLVACKVHTGISNKRVIIGGSVAGACVLLGMIIIIVCVVCKRKQKRNVAAKRETQRENELQNLENLNRVYVLSGSDNDDPPPPYISGTRNRYM
ncbi:unnamed protein product [Owenia fusiformis]|uniref:VWFA domain-containing protein n=1 Tax=Owenia fusiformis TaxID=6347 RepID=A0A8S4N9W3_OWEFU|nr:unnamed protein product [Owenia fusiformis]